jgi:putative peptide zinc metalloprotease protein
MSPFLPAIARPLSLRLRPDVIVTRVEMAGAPTWIVQDPLALEHFHFTAEEFALVEALRQPVSIADLQRVFANRFPPRTLSPDAVWDFVRRLHEAGLVIANAAGQGGELLARERSDQSRKRAFAWMQILAIRFRGFDPDQLLDALQAPLRRLLSPFSFIVVAGIVGYALSLIVGQFDEFRSRLPELPALADGRNLPWLLATIGCVKVLHELGHAITCKYFGGQVRELGFMLLVFSPCLYCDVSDSWRFNSRWQRIAVSAAGMVVELFLAAAATIVWWHAQPGVVQLIALNVMLVASVGTLFINGNPLLRYDGYYLLSDLVEVPNLWQRSRDALRYFAARVFLGDAPADDALVPSSKRGWLAAYACASKAYVFAVCIAVFWWLFVLLYPLHLQNLAVMLGLTMLAGALIPPATSVVRTLHNPIQRAKLPTGRLAAVGSLTLAAIVALLAWPVDYYVRAPLVLMPDGAERIYATLDGVLTSAVRPGETVSAGEPVATLDNPAVGMELLRIRGDLRLQQLRVEHLERLRSFDPAVSEKLPAARASLATLETRFQQLQKDSQRLLLAATRDGVVMPPPSNALQNVDVAKLPTWSGELLKESNRGARVTPGTLVCLVGNPTKLTAVLLAEDSDAPHLRPGQAVRMQLEQLPGDVVIGEVFEVSRAEQVRERAASDARNDLTSLFAGLVAPGEVRAQYQAHVRFDLPKQPLVWGGRGVAKVTIERITLGQRLWRYVARTFRLPLG